MTTDDPIIYLRQAVKPVGRFSTLSATARELTLVVHFYVKTDNSSDAGASAASFCIAHKLECVDYICLPSQISRSQIAEHEGEHIEAYEKARQEGFAVVASVVLAWDTN